MRTTDFRTLCVRQLLVGLAKIERAHPELPRFDRALLVRKVGELEPEWRMRQVETIQSHVRALLGGES